MPPAFRSAVLAVMAASLLPAQDVFDRIAGVKALVYYPDLIHTSSIDFYRAGWQWIDRHLSQ
ncbi:MAG: hypothetical protein ACKV22_09140 [Bryobacteraceae bacterium]